MEDQIFLLINQSLVELNESSFGNEDQFQELLENHPNIISGSQINPDNPRKWLLISREFGVPGEEFGYNKWSLDHLFIDQDGIPTLVEVKRSTDTRIRREIVGQMLDYAANAVSYWSLSEIKKQYENQCSKKDIDPAMKIQELIGENGEIDNFWEAVDINLRAGKIRLLFVADKISKELQRIIEFLNEQMSPAEVLGVEIKQFENDANKTLVPRVIGQTSNAQKKKGIREYNKWTEETFYEELEKRNGKESVDIVKNLVKHFESKVSRIWYGTGKQSGSLIPTIDFPTISYYPFAIWTYGKIETYFQWYKDKKPFDSIEKRKELMNMLNEINGVDITEDKLDKRPPIPINLLKDKSAFDKFTKAYDWFLEQIKE